MRKNSIALVSNKSSVTKVKLFHFYPTRVYSLSMLGYFSLCSARSVRIIKGADKNEQVERSAKIRSIISQTRQWIHREDSTKRKYFLNSVLALKKNYVPITEYMLGSILIDIKRKKYLSYFVEIF